MSKLPPWVEEEWRGLDIDLTKAVSPDVAEVIRDFICKRLQREKQLVAHVKELRESLDECHGYLRRWDNDGEYLRAMTILNRKEPPEVE